MGYTRDISSAADIIDSRDLVSRVEELEEQKECTCVFADDNPPGTDDPDDCPHGLDEDEQQELDTLRELVEDIDSNAGDMATDGVSLIADSYFEEYARQLADDIGAIDSDAGWPLSYIDWERAANALKMDYSTVMYEGMEFWVRA